MLLGMVSFCYLMFQAQRKTKQLYLHVLLVKLSLAMSFHRCLIHTEKRTDLTEKASLWNKEI